MNLTWNQTAHFWSQCDVCNDDACWSWKGDSNEFTVEGQPYQVAKLAYMIATGVKSDILQVLHTCNNPNCMNCMNCMNPAHLRFKTINDVRSDQRDYLSRCKVARRDYPIIRALLCSRRELAILFDVSIHWIRRFLQGQIYTRDVRVATEKEVVAFMQAYNS